MRWTGTEKIVRVGKKLRYSFNPFVEKSSWNFRMYETLRTFKALAHLSMSCFIQQIFAITTRSRRETEQNVLAPNFSGEMTPTFVRQIFSATYRPSFCKVWLSSVCWSPSAKPGNKVECKIYGGWAKTHFEFEAVCGPKFMLFRDDVGDPL